MSDAYDQREALYGITMKRPEERGLGISPAKAPSVSLGHSVGARLYEAGVEAERRKAKAPSVSLGGPRQSSVQYEVMATPVVDLVAKQMAHTYHQAFAANGGLGVASQTPDYTWNMLSYPQQQAWLSVARSTLPASR